MPSNSKYVTSSKFKYQSSKKYVWEVNEEMNTISTQLLVFYEKNFHLYQNKGYKTLKNWNKKSSVKFVVSETSNNLAQLTLIMASFSKFKEKLDFAPASEAEIVVWNKDIATSLENLNKLDGLKAKYAAESQVIDIDLDNKNETRQTNSHSNSNANLTNNNSNLLSDPSVKLFRVRNLENCLFLLDSSTNYLVALTQNPEEIKTNLIEIVRNSRINETHKNSLIQSIGSNPQGIYLNYTTMLSHQDELLTSIDIHQVTDKERELALNYVEKQRQSLPQEQSQQPMAHQKSVQPLPLPPPQLQQRLTLQKLQHYWYGPYPLLQQPVQPLLPQLPPQLMQPQQIPFPLQPQQSSFKKIIKPSSYFKVTSDNFPELQKLHFEVNNDSELVSIEDSEKVFPALRSKLTNYVKEQSLEKKEKGEIIDSLELGVENNSDKIVLHPALLRSGLFGLKEKTVTRYTDSQQAFDELTNRSKKQRIGNHQFSPQETPKGPDIIETNESEILDEELLNLLSNSPKGPI